MHRADFSFFLKSGTDERAKAAKAKEPMWKKAAGTAASIAGSIGGYLVGSTAKQPKGYPSPWDLPEVSDGEVQNEMAVQREDGAATRGSKKPASPRKSSSPTKKPSSPTKKPASPRKSPSPVKKSPSPKKPSSPRKLIRQDSGDEDVSTDDDGDHMMSGGLR